MHMASSHRHEGMYYWMDLGNWGCRNSTCPSLVIIPNIPSYICSSVWHQLILLCIVPDNLSSHAMGSPCQWCAIGGFKYENVNFWHKIGCVVCWCYRSETKGRFTPRGWAKPHWGRLHGISTLLCWRLPQLHIIIRLQRGQCFHM